MDRIYRLWYIVNVETTDKAIIDLNYRYKEVTMAYDGVKEVKISKKPSSS